MLEFFALFRGSTEESRINTVKRIVKQRILVQEKRGRWSPKVQDDEEALAQAA